MEPMKTRNWMDKAIQCLGIAVLLLNENIIKVKHLYLERTIKQ